MASQKAPRIAHKHHKHHGRPGCNTAACDRRVAHVWFIHHPPPKPVITGWAIPAAIVECESGFKNDPPNPEGAAGYYQLTEWSAKGGRGGGYANEHSKAEQDAVAGHLYREQGTGPWVSSESCWGGRI